MIEKKKLLFITHSSQSAGGAENGFDEIIEYFYSKRDMYEIWIIFPDGYWSEKYKELCDRAIQYNRCFLPVARRPFKEYFYFMRSFIEIHKLFNDHLKDQKFDACFINDDFVIIYSGRLSYAKGLERLIELFNEFRGNKKATKLIILRNGELRDYLTQQVSKYNLEEDCYFVDFNDNYISYINASDLFLLPSVSESTNLGVQEAMILKKLVLSSDTVGMTELIIDTDNGFLFKSGDYCDLLRKLNYIYSNGNKFNEVRFNASKTIYRKFNLRINIQMIENIMKNNYKRS